MINYYSVPDKDFELNEILSSIPEWQERFLRLLQIGVVKDEKDYAQEMTDMVIGLVEKAYETGKQKGKDDALLGADE